MDKLCSTAISKLLFSLVAVLLLSFLPDMGWGQNSKAFTTSGSFTIPAGVTSITVECWGAGGGGGPVIPYSNRGGGGGGGAYAKSVISVTPGATYSYVIGSGGGPKNSGGDTYFGSSLVLAKGGTGATSDIAGVGGNKNSSIGDVCLSGGSGANGSNSKSGGGGGAAGASQNGGSASGTTAGIGYCISPNTGNGGTGVNNNNKGNNGNSYGGGGSGSGGFLEDAGSGAAGVIVITIPPIVSFDPNSINFGYTTVNTYSEFQTITYSGSYLTPSGTISIGASPSNFETSLDNSTWNALSKTINYTGGNLTATLYVRFKPTVANANYMGSITISGGGATLQTVAVKGTSIPPSPVYYSYQTGLWNNDKTWTTDPSGTTQVGNTIPGDNDIVVILPNRTVTLPGDISTAGLNVTINESGFLDLSTHQFKADLSSLSGQGTLRIASAYFPTALANGFVQAGGGTTEYVTGITLPTQGTYCNLKINASGATVLQSRSLTLNGSLYVKAGTFQINDATAQRLQLAIAGNVTVDAGAAITVGTGVTNTQTSPLGITGGTAPFIGYYDAQSHRIVVNGDFTNHGTVRFTNLAYPVYDKFSPTTNGANSGFATVYFRGASDNTLVCDGPTDFYNLVLDKGIDQTFKLTVYTSGAYKNFRLFGANTSDSDGGGANPNLRKALWIRIGTLVLEGTTVIPSLTEGATANSDYYIPANGALVVNGIDVVVQTTADDYREVTAAYGITDPSCSNNTMGVSTEGSGSSLGLYGKLQMDNGYLTTKESGGIITSSVASGQLTINKGTVDAKQFLSLTGAASFEQNGGLFILRGRFQRTPSAYTSVSNLLNAPLNTVRTNDDCLTATAGTFNINNANNIFRMTGGTMRIYDVCGTTAPSYAFQVNSSAANSNVTGGVVEFVPTSGTAGSADAANHLVSTTAPLGSVTINRASSSSKVQLGNALSILNDLTISSGDFNANSFDVTVGGNVSIAAGTTYKPGINTTTLNGRGPQTFTVNLDVPLSLNKLTIDKAAGVAVTFAGVQKTINVQDNFRLALGTLNDNGNTINMSKDVYNSGVHAGAGNIVLNGTVAQAIDGNGMFQNLDLNNTTDANAAPVSLAANTTIKGILNLASNKIFNIASYNLNIASTGSIAATAFSSSCYIHTSGQSGDGGITKAYTSNTPFTFPVGCFSAKRASDYAYTPATIGFSSNPTSYGSITVAPVGYEHPATTTNDNSLTFYWRVKSTGFAGYAGKVTHSFVYSPTDAVGTLASYVPTLYNRSDYSWNNGLQVNINTATSTISDWTSPAKSADFLDADYTAGDAAFDTPKVYYSLESGLWSSTSTWTFSSTHTGAQAGSIPDANDVVVIGNNHTVKLGTADTTPNADPRSCASLQIEKGATLDIGYNPSSSFGMVLSHPNGNGNFRLTTSWNTESTFEFPSGDFSDFNINLGTTELYSTNSGSGTTYWLPNGIGSYGNLIISPLGKSNIIFPNNDLTIYGNLITRGQNADSWFCPTWDGDYPGSIERISKTITVKGDFDIQGGSFGWYGRSGGGAQNMVVYGNVIVAANAGIDVWWSNTSQSMSIGGSLINNTTGKVFSDQSTCYCNFTNVPVTFFGNNSSAITNTINTPKTIFSKVTVNKGTSQATTLTCNIGGTLTTPTDSWLTLQNGTFIYDRAGEDFSITTTSPFTIPSTAGLDIANAANVYLANSATSTANDVSLNGKLTIRSGNVYVGTSNGTTNISNDIEYSGGGASEIEVQGGTLMVNGQIRRNPAVTNGILAYTQSGGAVTINGNAANTTNAKLEVLNTGSVFNMSGGTLNIIRGGGGSAYGDLYLRPATSSVTGGTINFTNVVPNAAQNYLLDASVPLNNLTITGADAGRNAVVKLMVNPLVLNGNLTLANGQSILDANAAFNIGVTVNGDFTNNGAYNHYNNTTMFNGGVQSLLGTSATDFYNLTVKPVTSLTLGGTHSTLQGTITVNHDINLASGSLICGANRVFVKNSVVNNATYTNSNSTSGFVLNGSSRQHISGTGRFGQLELNNPLGSTLDNSMLMTKDLVLTSGVFDINQQLLSLSENSSIVPNVTPFNATKMITSDGVWSNVGISKVFPKISAPTTFTYPLGTTGKYTPATLTIAANSSVGTIRINNINRHHPAVTDPDNVLQYYWEVESTGISGFSGNLLLSYKAPDVKGGPESSYIAAQLLTPGTNWSKFGTDKVDETNHTITFNYSGSDNITGECTAGNDVAIPSVVPQYTSNSDGSWSNKAIWTPSGGSTYPCPEGGPNGFIVTVNHVVTLDKSYCDAYKTYINKEVRAVSPYYGHSLGTVYGNGTLYLESSIFPAGRFNSFLDCSSSATVEYGGVGTYNVTADLFSSIPKMKFTGTGVRVLPNKDLTICKELNIVGPTLDNSVNNRRLNILGTMLLTSGSFKCGSGSGATVSFAGSSAQTVKDFNGTNTFNNLEVNNSEGLALTSQIDVAGQLLLTNGLITTKTESILKITNYSVNCVIPAGGRSSSFVNGPLMKKINQGDPSFIYPIGKASYGLGDKFALRATDPGTQYWVAEMFNPNTLTTYLPPLTGVNTKEYWKVSEVAKASSAFVEIGWNPSSDLTPLMTQNGVSDMRVAEHNDADWVEIASSAADGSNSNTGSVETSVRTALATGDRKYTLACKNVVKPRIRLTPAGPVCGTAGIPVTLTTTLATSAPYKVSYTENGGAPKSIAPTSFPATIPTAEAGATYRLTGFTYTDSDGKIRDGVIDATPVVAYHVPTTAIAGGDISLCGGSSAVLAGNNPAPYTGLWSIVSGSGGNVEKPTECGSNFTGENGKGYTLSWTISSGTCTSSDIVKINFPLLPAKPDDFTGATTPVCRGASGITYTVPNDPTATSYIWSYGGIGATIHNSTTNPNSVTVDFDNSATSGNLSVAITNNCGTSDARTMNIIVVEVNPGEISSVEEPACFKIGTPVKLDSKEAATIVPSVAPTYAWEMLTDDGAGGWQASWQNISGESLSTYSITSMDIGAQKLLKMKVHRVATSLGCSAVSNDITINRQPVTGPPYHVSNSVAK